MNFSGRNFKDSKIGSSTLSEVLFSFLANLTPGPTALRLKKNRFRFFDDFEFAGLVMNLGFLNCKEAPIGSS